jgi:hypothetical protein
MFEPPSAAAHHIGRGIELSPLFPPQSKNRKRLAKRPSRPTGRRRFTGGKRAGFGNDMRTSLNFSTPACAIYRGDMIAPIAPPKPLHRPIFQLCAPLSSGPGASAPLRQLLPSGMPW